MRLHCKKYPDYEWLIMSIMIMSKQPTSPIQQSVIQSGQRNREQAFMLSKQEKI